MFVTASLAYIFNAKHKSDPNPGGGLEEGGGGREEGAQGMRGIQVKYMKYTPTPHILRNCTNLLLNQIRVYCTFASTCNDVLALCLLWIRIGFNADSDPRIHPTKIREDPFGSRSATLRHKYFLFPCYLLP